VLNRLGARTWGGIGLSIALVIALACLPTIRPAMSTASDANPFSPSNLASDDKPQSPIAGNENVANHAGNFDPTNEENTRIGMTEQQANPGYASAQHSSSNSKASSGNEPGSTAGASITSTVENATSNTIENSASGTLSNTGQVAGGVGGAAKTGLDATSNSTASLVNSTPRSIPPWESSTWQLAGDNANNAISHGSIPADYRDMVHAYFDRDAFQNK
jgi:hypothetical protein